MKKLAMLSAIVFALASCALFAQQGPNPSAVALLRWYSANTVTQFYAGGGAPIGVAFDGQNMWVVSNSRHSVSKIRASDWCPSGDVPGW